MRNGTLLLGVSLVALAGPVNAQTASAETASAQDTAEAPAQPETIIVTGSRIARSALEASVPVTAVTVQELMRTGEVSLGDTLNELPQFRSTFSTQNSGRFIGTAGLNILDLRGMGTARTLVLQSGRRHVTSQPGASTVDVNTIPTDLVERIDVVTGANSAVYGSDAIAGVVNFVMMRDFEGLRVRGQTGISGAGDRPASVFSLTAGRNFNDGRGNVAVNFEFTKQAPLFYTDRDDLTGAYSGRDQFNLSENTLGEPSTGNGVPDNTFFTGVKNNNISNGGLYTSACPAPTPTNAARRALNCTGLLNQAGTAELGRTFVFLPDGTLVANPISFDFRPFGSSNAIGGLGSTLRETGLLQVGVTRYAGNLLASYEFSPMVRPFLEFKYVRSEAIQEGQPTFFSGTLPSTFRLDNPFLTQQARDLLTTSLAPGATTFSMLRFNVDFAGRGEDHERDLYRVVAGVDGELGEAWRYELAFNYGHVNTFYRTRGNVNVQRVRNAVDAALDPSGRIVCRINVDANPNNDDPTCIPLNIFGEKRFSPEALQDVLVDSTREQWSEQINIVGYVSGDTGRWFSLPGGPVSMVLGGEWRQERSYSAFDAFTRSGATFLNAIAIFDPPRLGVTEFFAEARLPVLADLKFVRELSLEAATRYSDYNVGGTGGVWTYNATGVWAPARDIRIRGGYGRAIRAPTMSDLFAAGSQTFLNGLVDPCGQQNINNNPNRVANCAAAGVPTTQTFNGITEPFTNRPASGISGLSGGNPNLTEERSKSYTLGAVIQPRWTPGLNIAVDWYDIQIGNVINTIGAQTVINQCYDSPSGINNQFCAAIFRRPDGTFRGQTNVIHAGETVSLPLDGPSFLQGPFNYARQQTRGIDIDVTYTYPSQGDWGITGRAVISHLMKRDFYTDINQPNFRTQAKLDLGDPAWAGTLTLSPSWRNFELTWRMQYIGKMTIASYETMNSVDGRPPTNPDAFPFTFYPDRFYHDLQGQVTLADQFRIFVGVDNVVNTKPPFGQLGDGAGSAVWPNSGRFFYMGADLRFGGTRRSLPEALGWR